MYTCVDVRGNQTPCITHFEISFGRERFQADRAPKWLVARVRPHVNLQCGGRWEILVAHCAQMFGRTYSIRTTKDKTVKAKRLGRSSPAEKGFSR